ncbi:MAG: lysine 5,6-aminomutase subunit alpha [Clostridiales bacterium]|jgi:beta-lysine 5,6-aminomutase alpha subunit|nr:lysine 5,6-aminomutase subunit alpha [Clostridiales bacterium]
MNKLNFDAALAEKARSHARRISEGVERYINAHTTVTVERAICRLLGIDGVRGDVPLPNIIVDSLAENNAAGAGAAYFIGNAMMETGLPPQEIADQIAAGGMELLKLPRHSVSEIRQVVGFNAKQTIQLIKANRAKRELFLEEYGERTTPLLYVIVATGNIFEDIVQAKAAVKQGADVIAVIRSTGQSLLDYVPYGATTEGFGGTFATQENFRLMRAALDEAGAAAGRYIRLCNYCSGLCMPEIAAMGALERLDVMLNDALYGILFRDINMRRTMIDQHFSRVINGFAGVIINTGEDNYLTTADAVEEAHTVLASQFINERFALGAGVPKKQMGLGHAFEIDPSVRNGFLFELAHAQLSREIFPEAPLKYMPPTKYMTGNIFMGYAMNTLFNAVTVMTGQSIHLLGMLTEAIHTPFMSDRALAIENARYIYNTMADLNGEIMFKEDGIIQRRANEVLGKACDLLAEIERDGLFKTLEKGAFAGVRRDINGGKGGQGVFEKESLYFNPFEELMLDREAAI